MNENIKKQIEEGKTSIGIEFGSTRIKAVLINGDCTPVASGDFTWENDLKNGYWTYSLEDVKGGLGQCYANLKADVKAKYGVSIAKAGSIGISAMMHGYLAFDENYNLLTPFRTWRNTTTAQAAERLSELFKFNIPQRWSVSHLYQAILNKEPHVKGVAHITTLAGYVHYLLTGENVLGIGDASGMFPIDSVKNCYDEKMLESYNELTGNFPKKAEELLPKIMLAGEQAGALTKEGALLLDPSGELAAGIPFCPPEGDAGTGMTATNSVREKTGNTSAGTSVFSMVVLEKPLDGYYKEIDMVTTPSGKPVAMVHCNNCTNEINAWAKVFSGFLQALGQQADMGAVYEAMFSSALNGEKDGGGILLYNYLSGESVTDFEKGAPLLVRKPESRLNFENFMRAQLYSALATLKIGMNILSKEGCSIDKMYGHGGFFKTPLAGQKIMAGALNVPISVMETAGEGGPWGMAVLAGYMINKKDGESLEEYLSGSVFKNAKEVSQYPDEADVKGFNKFLESYIKGLEIERKAVEVI